MTATHRVAGDGAERLLEALAELPVIAILRGRRGEDGRGDRLEAVVDVLVAGGIRALEITLPTPGALEAVAGAVRRHGGTVSIGAGTVTDEAQVAAVHEAGAHFVVSPGTDAGVLRAATALGLGSLPGAMTPTEVMSAVGWGATAVKLFPARSLGPDYVRDLLAPLPELRLVPVGGVGLPDVAAYLSAGACAVGVGSPLLGDALDGGDLGALETRAAAYVSAARAMASSHSAVRRGFGVEVSP